MANLIDNLLSKLKSRGVTSADIAASIGDAEAALGAARLAASEAEQAYRGALLESDAVAKAAQDRLADANRAVDRAMALVDRLQADHMAALAAEAKAALDAERAAVEAEAVAVAKELRSSYPKLANGLVALLLRLRAAEEAVSRVNAKLDEADRDDRLAAVEWRARSVPANSLPDFSSIRFGVRIPADDAVPVGWRW